MYPANTDAGNPRKPKGPKERGGARDNCGVGAGVAKVTGRMAALINEESVQPMPGVGPHAEESA